MGERAVREQHGAWSGFDADAMWVELDAIEASARAARAAKAARQAKAAAAAASQAPEAGTKPGEPASEAESDTGTVRDTARGAQRL